MPRLMPTPGHTTGDTSADTSRVALAGSLVEALGGSAMLPRMAITPEELIEEVREGLPYGCLETFGELFGVSREELSEVLAIPLRTLARRKKEGQLRADESDRLLRVALMAILASDVLGGDEAAGRWLHRPNRALGGRVPLHLLDTDLGSRRVEEALGRLDHGVVG